MKARIHFFLESPLHARACRRAARLGLSLADYVRHLVLQDLVLPRPPLSPACVFDLGDSGGSDIGRHRGEMTGDAFAAQRGPQP